MPGELPDDDATGPPELRWVNLGQAVYGNRPAGTRTRRPARMLMYGEDVPDRIRGTEQGRVYYDETTGVEPEPDEDEAYEAPNVWRQRHPLDDAVINALAANIFNPTIGVQADTFALDDDTPTPDIRFNEVKFKKGVIKEVIIDEETYKAIEDITQELIFEDLEILREIYEKRLDFVARRDYNALIESYPHGDDDNGIMESVSFRRFENTALNFALLAQGNTISMHGQQAAYLKRLEEKAQQRYNIEHSKYQYYPRLKSKVKYGNAELLAKILTVAHIGKGKVICKRQ